MKIFKKTNCFVLMLLVAMIATSCSDKEVFDSNAIYNQKKSEFTSNFIKKYGEIDPNQSWDFSTGSHVYSLSLPKATRGATRAVTADPADYLTIQDWYEVDLNTVGWMTSTLTNGKNHRNLGNPFYMVVPENEFFIVPIFEGYADFVWTLHIVVDDYDGNGESLDISVWTKHQDIQKKTTNDPNEDWANITEVKGNTQDAKAVRAKPIEVNLTQYKGKKMYLYLENTKYGEPRNPASSLAYKMLALNIPAESMPANIDESYKKMIIACEDQAIDSKSDHDYNDVVFMVYGKPDIPDVNRIEKPIYDSFSKRYMIEDLGITDDFDFNDVVVDVFDITSKTAVYDVVDGIEQFKEWEDETHSQEAIVRSLGGTLDITLKIGGTTWTKSGSEYPVSQMVNTSGAINYNAELAKFPIVNKDWDFKTNNVSATVGDKASGKVLTITFPKVGEAPMIIGFDVNEHRNWMNERQSIPSSWFTEVDD
jgi:hypothetical protein